MEEAPSNWSGYCGHVQLNRFGTLRVVLSAEIFARGPDVKLESVCVSW